MLASSVAGKAAFGTFRERVLASSVRNVRLFLAAQVGVRRDPSYAAPSLHKQGDGSLGAPLEAVFGKVIDRLSVYLGKVASRGAGAMVAKSTSFCHLLGGKTTTKRKSATRQERKAEREQELRQG